MGGCIVYVVVAVAAFLLVAEPVTATTIDTNGTEVSGTCGPVWSMLAGSRPNYEDAASTNATDIGVTPDAQAVRATCQRNAVRRVGIGIVVLGAAFAAIRLRQRRSVVTDGQPINAPDTSGA